MLATLPTPVTISLEPKCNVEGPQRSIGIAKLAPDKQRRCFVDVIAARRIMHSGRKMTSPNGRQASLLHGGPGEDAADEAQRAEKRSLLAIPV